MVQPASYDVHLGDSFVVYDSKEFRAEFPVDPLKYVPTGKHVESTDVIIIKPQEFLLATTLEVICINKYLVARVEGVSSLGRMGLTVHTTAGYIDPGFNGQITLELYNMAPYAMRLTSGMRIAQIAFERLTGPSMGYKGRYQSQLGVTRSRYGLVDLRQESVVEPKEKYL